MILNYKGMMIDEVNRTKGDLQTTEDYPQTTEDDLQTMEDDRIMTLTSGWVATTPPTHTHTYTHTNLHKHNIVLGHSHHIHSRGNLFPK